MNGGYTVKGLMSRILGIFKKKDGREFYFNDIYRVCMSASKELGDYCKAEGYSNR